METLPPPVESYLCAALKESSEIRSVRLTQVGQVRADVSRNRWMTFDADHLVTLAPPTFEWNARVRVAPFVHLRVRDAYRDGQGGGSVSVLSVPLSRAANTREINSGSLHRYLAEAPWYPDALQASDRLRWLPVNDSAAIAELTDHGLSVSLEFRFTASGDVSGIYTPARWGRFGHTYRQCAWEGHFSSHAVVDGIRIPTSAEVGWYIAGRWEPVWIATITDFAATRG